MAEQKRCPVFKRRCFWEDHLSFLQNGLGTETADLMRFVHHHTTYDTDMIWEHLLRTKHLCDLVDSLHLHYILGTGTLAAARSAGSKADVSDVCLIMHLCHPETFGACFARACNMPKGCDVYLLTDSRKKADALRALFVSDVFAKVEVRVISDVASNAAALLIGASDIVFSYDLCCFAHDSRAHRLKPGLLGYSFAEHSLRNLLASTTFCADVKALFARNPRLGLLVPPVPYYAIWCMTAGNEWAGGTYFPTLQLAQQMQLHAPMAPDKPPIAPLGNMFWFRPEALRPAFEMQWNYGDFIHDTQQDSTNQAVMRIYPFVAQHCGYYAAIASEITMAQSQLVTQTYYEARNNHILFQKGVLHTLRPGQVQTILENARLRKYHPDLPLGIRMRLYVKRMLPPRLRKALIVAKRRLLHQDVPYFDEYM